MHELKFLMIFFWFSAERLQLTGGTVIESA